MPYGDFISVSAVQWVFRYSKSKGATRFILVAISAGCNTDGWSWPSLDTITKFTSYSRPRILQAIEELCGLGEIIVHAGGGAGNPNRYFLSGFWNENCKNYSPETVNNGKEIMENSNPCLQEELEEVKENKESEEVTPLAFPKPQKRVKTRTSFRRQESRVRQIDADPRPPWLIDKDNREAKAKSESDEAVEKMKWFLSLGKKKASK